MNSVQAMKANGLHGAAGAVHIDTASYVRLGWCIIGVGIAGFLLWAAVAPLDKGVPMSGSVAVDTNRKAVQHPTGGTVDQILVRDGDRVSAGQVLVRMNGVAVEADADITRVQYISARTLEARLTAERDGQAGVALSPALRELERDARLTGPLTLQRALFISRRDTLTSELRAMDEAMEGVRLQLGGTSASRLAKQEQLRVLNEQLGNLRDLAADGYVARSRVLEMERNHAQLTGALAEDAGTIGRAERQIGELRLRRAQRLQEFQRDVQTQLADVQRDAEALAQRMRSQALNVRNVELKAPVDGVVMGVTVFSRGAVVAPGAKLMDIVPAADALIVEGQLPVHLVDKVYPGLPLELIFSAFNASKTPHIAGVVATVAPDRIVDERTGQPYYRVRAAVTEQGLKQLAASQLSVRPGMPVELFVKTGERTLLSYLLQPVLDRTHVALSEE